MQVLVALCDSESSYEPLPCEQMKLALQVSNNERTRGTRSLKLALSRVRVVACAAATYDPPVWCADSDTRVRPCRFGDGLEEHEDRALVAAHFYFGAPF